MRLLNTTTFELENFLGENTPEYAILSHTWGEEEIIFQDLSAKASGADDSWKTKKSFKKVSGFCSLARGNGYQWCWIDTCCIDKSSSAELSEAINSMFRWYAKSHLCFVYLADMRVDHDDPEQLNGFERSRWHKRGWTLQELLAPERVEFYDFDWNQIGTRFSLRERISSITSIRPEILTNKFDVGASQNKYCVAEKMSWAASRSTSRVEDLAYCLLGIFDVNMPLLYGEGSRAFERLQFQILAETEDLTLFAWQGPPAPITFYWSYNPKHLDDRLLAKSPSDFSEFADKYLYRSLEAGSYNRVWKGLNSLSKRLDIATQQFTPDQPVKRLGTIVLSVAIVTYSSYHLMILCRFREVSSHGQNQKYLVLPIALYGASTLYAKSRGPEPHQLQPSEDTVLPPEVSMKRISIQMKTESRWERQLNWDWNSLEPIRPSAVILSLEGQESSSKQFFLHNIRYPSAAVLLRHEATEALILYGWYEAGNSETPEVVPWTVITSWEELHIDRNLLPTEGKKKNPGAFARRLLCRGKYIYSTIKPLVRGWCASNKSAMSESQFRALVDPPRALFSLNVIVKSLEGKPKRVGYLGMKEFSDYGRLGDWIDEVNPSPRDVLLVNPQWEREL